MTLLAVPPAAVGVPLWALVWRSPKPVSPSAAPVATPLWTIVRRVRRRNWRVWLMGSFRIPCESKGRSSPWANSSRGFCDH